MTSIVAGVQYAPLLRRMVGASATILRGPLSHWRCITHRREKINEINELMAKLWGREPFSFGFDIIRFVNVGSQPLNGEKRSESLTVCKLFDF